MVKERITIDDNSFEEGDIVLMDGKLYRIEEKCEQGYYLEECDEDGELKKALDAMGHRHPHYWT